LGDVSYGVANVQQGFKQGGFVGGMKSIGNQILKIPVTAKNEIKGGIKDGFNSVANGLGRIFRGK
jgi:hypothetical protein